MRPAVDTFADLARAVLASPARCGPVRLVAVDGPGGSGKSTFAGRLQAALTVPSVLLHTDDFASWDEPLNWWPRLEDQVLGPLGKGATARYQRYDWGTGALAEWHDVPPLPCVVLEGVSAARAAVADRLSLALWISTPPAERLRRGLARDGDEALGQWRSWMADEDRHYAEDRTGARADVVVDGAPVLAHDPGREFVRLR